MAGSLARAVADFKRLPRRLVEAGAQRFDTIAKASAGRATGGRMGRRRGGVRETVEFGTVEHITETPGVGCTAAIVGTPAGPWVWIEFGTKPHWIGATGQLLGERLDHPVYGPVLHPGIVGRRAWTDAVNRMDHEIDPVIDRELRRIA